MSQIADRVESLGYRVFRVPEAATLMFGGGFSLDGVSPAQLVELEATMVRTVMSLEDRFAEAARVYGDRAVLLCDRGLMDIRAYVPERVWRSILDEIGQTEVGLRDARYDAVLHLVTAADGAEEFYTTANNVARRETPEQARDLDRRTQEAWLGHPHLRVVGNETGFDEKVRAATAAACRVLGIPEPLEVERKFLLEHAPRYLPVRAVTVGIEQVYLLSEEGTEARVRRRGHDGGHVYTHTVKRRLGPGRAVEVERPISSLEYVHLLDNADPACRPIRKKRTCFVWEGRYFEMDEFDDRPSPLATLEVELADIDDPVALPPFLPIVRELTGDPEFSNRRLARRA